MPDGTISFSAGVVLGNVHRVTIAYLPLSVGLAICLAVNDSTAALIVLPYVLYLPYAIWWVRQLRALNA